MQMELPESAGLAVVECRLLGEVCTGDDREMVIELSGGNRVLDLYGVPMGVEGSLVKDGAGALVGVISGTVGAPPSLVVTARRMDACEEVWKRAETAISERHKGRPLGNSWKAVNPGDHVLVASRRNPLPRDAGIATVVQVRGGAALCIVSERGRERFAGEWNRWVVRARPVAVAPLPGGARADLLCESGDVIGRAVYTCRLGVIVLFGEAPTITELHISVIQEGHSAKRQVLEVARDVRGGGGTIAAAVRDYLWYESYGEMEGVGVLVAADGDVIADGRSLCGLGDVAIVCRDVVQGALVSCDSTELERVEVEVRIPATLGCGRQ